MCESSKTNPARKDGKPDYEWGGTHNSLYADYEERVALEVIDTELNGRLYRLLAISIDEKGLPHPWTREANGATASQINDPGTTGHTSEHTLVIIAINSVDVTVATDRCPVKIVFGPRLG